MLISLRDRVRTSSPALGAWLFLREPIAAETASQAGYDYVCVDAQHGLADEATMAAHLAATAAGGDALAFVRVVENSPAAIGRALDIGASGVIIPMVNTAAQARAAVAACHYAPLGVRSIGPIGAITRYGTDYVGRTNEHITVIPMIETAEAIDNVDEIAATPGVDALYVGPSDLSLTLGLPADFDHDDNRFDTALEAVVSACRRSNIVPGIQAAPGLAAKRWAQGFQMITIGYDGTPLVASLHSALAEGRKETA